MILTLEQLETFRKLLSIYESHYKQEFLKAKLLNNLVKMEQLQQERMDIAELHCQIAPMFADNVKKSS